MVKEVKAPKNKSTDGNPVALSPVAKGKNDQSSPARKAPKAFRDGSVSAGIAAVALTVSSYGGGSVIANAGKPEWQMTPVEKMARVKEGVSKKDLETLKSKTNLDYDKLSAVLSTTRATLINKKGSEHFSPSLGEKIISIADLYSYGFEVFEDSSAFNVWVFRPNRALEGRAPFELLDNQFGREEVKNLIGRIDYGVYS